MPFGGKTYDPKKDKRRLLNQLATVKRVMLNHRL